MSLGLGTRAILKLDEIREGIKARGQGVGSGGGGGDGSEACATCLAIKKKGYRVEGRDWEEQRQAMSKRDHVAVSQEWYKSLKSATAKKNKP
ncbi:hypothetical protein BGW36DRAFT_432613 [Talaromyces proteolyticus]|uniref:Uncharacterized protein n=1 Tax=Talaromyces proteolyticus TaxID=1131652 RepID=A0AAD4KGV6_9EURO|nr:uncharacterized protein BGW36DRAFT_432613 [Talaromyces proteolyticus]KAH8690830.1 hypothetical protein BGW36DRAFT_432613 [Talaromyces proteolyticus]